jgi:hypothetical protein
VFVAVVPKTASAEAGERRKMFQDIGSLFGKYLLCPEQGWLMEPNGMEERLFTVLPRMLAIVPIHLPHIEGHDAKLWHISFSSLPERC